jgi:hypothetical protein
MNERDTEPRGTPQNLFVGGCQIGNPPTFERMISELRRLTK